MRVGRFNGLLGSWYRFREKLLVWGKADEVAYSIKPTPDRGYIALGFILWTFKNKLERKPAMG